MLARGTLTRLYLYSALNGLQFTWTTWLAYVLAHGGNPGWAESAFHLAILLGEVPTGVIADLFGRRTSMLVGLAMGAVASASFLWIHDTWSASLVLAFSGLASTFLSGADTALLYETAEEAGGAEFARRALARASALQMGALSISPAIAGFLFQWHDWAPAIARAVVSGLAVLAVRGIVEKRSRRDAEVPEGHGAKVRPGRGADALPGRRAVALLRSVWGQARAGMRALHDRMALPLMLFGWVYYTSGAMVGQFGQAYFPYSGLTMAATGVIFAVGRGLATGGSLLADRLSSRAALWYLNIAPLGLSLVYLGMGLGGGWWGVPFFFMGRGLDGMLEPVYQHRVNQAIPSAQRATVLSLQSAGFSLLMAVAFPAASYLQPVTRVYLAVGAVGSVLSGAWLLRRSLRDVDEGAVL